MSRPSMPAGDPSRIATMAWPIPSPQTTTMTALAPGAIRRREPPHEHSMTGITLSHNNNRASRHNVKPKGTSIAWTR